MCRCASLYLEEEIPSEQVEKTSKEKERSEQKNKKKD